MGRPKKNREVTNQTPVTPVTTNTFKEKTVAEKEHDRLVQLFNGDTQKTNDSEVSKNNNSVENLNTILDSNTVDEIFENAKKDENTIISKSSRPEFENNVDEPPKAALKEVPKDLTIVGGQRLSYSDDDAPFTLAADDKLSRAYSVYDKETNRVVEDVFYANRNTNIALVFLRNENGQNIVVKDESGKENFVLVLKNREIYFKKNIKI